MTPEQREAQRHRLDEWSEKEKREGEEMARSEAEGKVEKRGKNIPARERARRKKAREEIEKERVEAVEEERDRAWADERVGADRVPAGLYVENEEEVEEVEEGWDCTEDGDDEVDLESSGS